MRSQIMGHGVRKARLLVGTALLVAFVAGCGRKTADQTLDKALKDMGASRATLGAFSGTVSIDGRPPGNKGLVRLLVILWNQDKPPGPKDQPPFVPCDEEGNFEFSTYHAGDGVAVGKYVICFAQLKGSLTFGGGQRGWHGPDLLHNLYNDPEKNKDNKELVVEITPEGKTDWNLNLDIAGKEPVNDPGPNSFTAMR
jgi:hypothetical protein